MKRLFLAVMPDASTASALQTLQHDLMSVNSAHDAIRWTRPNQWHLTLHFLGSLENQEISELIYRLRAEDWQAFQSSSQTLDQLFLWPEVAAPRVIAAGSSRCQPELRALRGRLHKLIEAEGLWSDGKPFHPHVTLARTKESLGQGFRALPVPPVEFPIRGFHLLESRSEAGGSAYVPLADFELA